MRLKKGTAGGGKGMYRGRYFPDLNPKHAEAVFLNFLDTRSGNRIELLG